MGGCPRASAELSKRGTAQLIVYFCVAQICVSATLLVLDNSALSGRVMCGGEEDVRSKSEVFEIVCYRF